jgi:hypothetical protein
MHRRTRTALIGIGLLAAIVSVTYTYKHGEWLSVIDQGTEISTDSRSPAGSDKSL